MLGQVDWQRLRLSLRAPCLDAPDVVQTKDSIRMLVRQYQLQLRELGTVIHGLNAILVVSCEGLAWPVNVL